MAQFTQGMIPLMCCWNWCLISQYKDQVELSINRSCISYSQCSTTNLCHLYYIHLAISKTRAYFTYISWLHDKLTTITAPFGLQNCSSYRVNDSNNNQNKRINKCTKS